MRDVLRILIQLEADLLVPLGVLPAALDRFRAPFLTIEDELAVRILLAYVPLVREVPLSERTQGEREQGTAGRVYTHRFQDDDDEGADVATAGHWSSVWACRALAGGLGRRGRRECG